MKKIVFKVPGLITSDRDKNVSRGIEQSKTKNSYPENLRDLVQIAANDFFLSRSLLYIFDPFYSHPRIVSIFRFVLISSTHTSTIDRGRVVQKTGRTPKAKLF